MASGLTAFVADCRAGLDGGPDNDEFRFDGPTQPGAAAAAGPALAAAMPAPPEPQAAAALPDAILEPPAAAPLPTYSNAEIADQLQTGWWTWFGHVPRAFNMGASGTGANAGVLHYNVSALTAEGERLADEALAIYEQVLGIDFVKTTSTGTEVDIVFDDDDDAGAVTTWSMHRPTSFIDVSRVNVSTTWLASYGTEVGSYSFQTYLHEIGHALGLGHAGNYNFTSNYVTDSTDPNFGNDSNVFLNDSWQASMMSYFNQLENTSVDADYARLISPMAADWIALGNMYGIGAGAFAGDTTWGFNSTITTTVFASLAAYAGETAFTIIDGGGIDTLDFSGFAADQVIDLGAESVSDIGGLIGNMVIAAGSIIENARGGAGADTITGNAAANTLSGEDGDDSLQGGAGDDTMVGGLGDDTYYVGEAGDRAIEAVDAGTDVVYATISFTLGANLESLRMVPGSGAVNATGNELDNELLGTSAVNTLRGLGGADRCQSGDGADILIGGLGSDVFRFRSVVGSSPGARDTLRPGDDAAAFELPGKGLGDRIDLSAVDADSLTPGLQDFAFGNAKGTGRLWAVDAGARTLIRGNLDDDAAAELEIAIADGSSVAAGAYRAADFIL